jgi:hypothetical protein
MMGSMRGGRPKATWRATDLAWSRGTDPEVLAPVDARGVTIVGRGSLLDRLEGPGIPLVREWLRR